MSNLVDRVFAEVCLDERISDGVFRMEEEEHMNALRDYFVKRGIPKEAAVNVTNRMVEGKYPDRQAYRKEDGILVTWPSPQHKKKAFQENPGKYIEQNPFPKKEEPQEPEPKEPVKPEKDEPEEEEPTEEPSGERKANNLFDKEPAVSQDGKPLEVEPARGDEKPQPTSTPAPAPAPVQQPKTPQVVAAEKEVIKQIMKTDDTTLSNVANPINESLKIHQLRELYKKADELGYREAVKFLTPYVKP